MDGSTNVLRSFTKYFTRHLMSISYGLICVIPGLCLIQAVETIRMAGNNS